MVLRQPAEGLGDEGDVGAGEAADPYPPGAQPGVGLELGLGGREGAEDGLGVPGQGLSGLGELHLPAHAGEQRGADGAFERFICWVIAGWV